MSDPYGISDGIKAATGSINSIRESTKEISKTIEAIQKDGQDVATQRLKQKLENEKRAEARKDALIYDALEEYKRLRIIIDAEAEERKKFLQKYGETEWNKVLALKTAIEKERKRSKEYYGHDLDKVRRVQMLCFVAAFIVTLIVGKTMHLFPILLG